MQAEDTRILRERVAPGASQQTEITGHAQAYRCETT
jgi:hypothetical protein